MNAAPGIQRDEITMGLLAGGRATRLGGLDKAWLVRGGIAQVLRLHARFRAEVAQVLASANRDLPRYAAQGLVAVPDRVDDAGPLGGLDALADACRTPWLFTLPVDIVDANDCVLRTLVSSRAGDGAWSCDCDGPQPLVALWRVEALRSGLAAAFAAGEHAVHALQSSLDMRAVRFDGVRFGNLNTPGDLETAGVTTD